MSDEHIEVYDRFCREEFKALRRAVESLDDAIRGNGRPGLVIRVDRLEQNESTRARRYWILFTACVTSIIAFVGDVMLRHK